MIGEPRAVRRAGCMEQKSRIRYFVCLSVKDHLVRKGDYTYTVHEGTANFFLYVFAVKSKFVLNY